MSEPRERYLDLTGGRFRALEWEGEGPGVLLLHGLTAVAESWLPTVLRFAAPRRVVALEQRGHGRSTHEVPDPSAAGLARDTIDASGALGLEHPHLAGHSMGARVAIVAAARYPDAFRSVAIVDIGPEAWRQNWVDTVAALDRMKETLAPGELDAIVARRNFEPEMAAAFVARFERLQDGGAKPLGSREAMKAIVRAQRSRGYWPEWESIQLPALFVRGGDSDEVRPQIAKRMRERNPDVRYVELPGVGHNVPLLDPAALARALEAFWLELE
jgi:pimeloyl-ACP methyl ester carboxylesterase